MASITRQEVARIASLAHLNLETEELNQLTGELSAILDHIDQLREVDIDGVPATAHVHLEQQPLRHDATQPSLEAERILSGAPAHDNSGFVVPTFVDEG